MSNANFIYNVDYSETALTEEEMGDDNRSWLEKMNKAICSGIKNLKKSANYEVKDCAVFRMKTAYPGTLIGTGNSHSSGAKGEMELGFTFDYVTGVPYLPGSSLKGILKQAFDHPDYIEEILPGQKTDVLRKSIFGEETAENIDFHAVFLDSFIVGGTQKFTKADYMGLDNITPHGKSKLSEPNPITMIRINPEVVFEFRFIPAKEIGLDKEQQIKLFKTILTDFGIGAKTNVGYGLLMEYSETVINPIANSETSNNVKTEMVKGQQGIVESKTAGTYKNRAKKDLGYIIGEIYEGVVTGYNKTGKWANVALDNGGNGSFFDENHRKANKRVKIKYMGKREDGHDLWRLIGQ